MPAPPKSGTPAVFLVEDDVDVREGLAFHLLAAGFTVHSYETAELFLAAHTREMTGCLITDVRLPQMDGIGLIEALTRKGNTLPVIVISAFAQTSLVVDAMRAGAIDFLEKPLVPSAVLNAVRLAMQGASSTASLRSEEAVAATRIASLTPREREVFGRFATGASTKQVASDMAISAKTVEAFRSRLLDKLNARTPSELIRLAVLSAVFGSVAAGRDDGDIR
jgi:two-component system, LuxR family, response regulator FixJ